MGNLINVVRGNWFKLVQPLEKIKWESSEGTVVDYEPAVGDTLKVELVGAYNHYNMEKVQIELNPENNKRNLLTYENNGTLPLGLYDIEISVTLADGKRLHSCQPKRVKVVKTNSEASIPDYVEFGIETFTLQGEPFMYVPNGEGGGGEDGVGIDSITTVESPDDGGNNVVTIRLTDGTQSSFNVKNGHKGSDGAQGQPGTNGHDGANGATPEIRDGYWYINNTPTGVKAVGEDGHDGNDGSNGADGIGISSITVTENPNDGGNNVVTINLTEGNPVSFNVKNGSKGSDGNDGAPGANGSDGVTPHIDSTTGNWFIGSTDTLVHAQGTQGPQGVSGLYPLIEDTTSTSINATIEPNKFYVWKVPLTGNSTITLGTEVSGVMNEFLLQFSVATGSTPQISFSDNNLQWTGINTFQGGKTYQVSIVNGYAIGVEFDTITQSNP